MKRFSVILVSLLVVSILVLTGCSTTTEKAVETAESAVSDVAESAVTEVAESVDSVSSDVSDAVEAGKSAADDAVEAGKSAVSDAVEAGESAVADAVEAGKSAADDAVEAGKSAADDAVEAGKSAVADAVEAGESAVADAAGTASTAVSDLVAAAKADVAKVPFSKESPITLKVGASPVPHAEILAEVKDVLAEEGINLEVIEFTDYVQPNTALEDGSLDANYFQHFPYLDDFNKAREEENSDWITLVPLVYTHFEPMGVYKGKSSDLANLPEGAKIAVPNDPTNEARALLLLEANGLIKIDESKGLEATKKDIVENKKNFEIVELEAAQVARSLPDVAIAVINGNYALDAGLTEDDVLAQEDADSEAAKTYANLIAVREGDEELPQFVALKEAITSDAIRKFIEENYKGLVKPVF